MYVCGGLLGGQYHDANVGVFSQLRKLFPYFLGIFSKKVHFWGLPKVYTLLYGHFLNF
jgi:hypothetical protein